MTRSTWMERIQSENLNETGIEQMADEVSQLVLSIRGMLGQPTWRVEAKEARARVKEFRSAIKAISSLPAAYAEHPGKAELLNDLEMDVAKYEDVLNRLSKMGLIPRNKGNIPYWEKLITALACQTLLEFYKFDFSEANTARLALWVWTEAHERKQEERPCDLDAWETTSRRARLHKLEDGPRRRESAYSVFEFLARKLPRSHAFIKQVN